MTQFSAHLDAARLKKLPLLTAEKELQLAEDWQKKQDPKALTLLIESHQKLVNKIAAGYRGYGLAFDDLVAEGNIGMMHALKNFDTSKGFRFSTYAMWWIRAQIKEFIVKSASLVRMGTTASQRKLFFGFKKAKERLGVTTETLNDDMVKKVADELDVDEKDVRLMEKRLERKDSSLNKVIKASDDSNLEWQDWLADERETQEELTLKHDELNKRRILLDKALHSLKEREIKVLSARRLQDPAKTLEELSQEMGLSRERVRQIEAHALEKVRKSIKLSL